MGYWNGCWAGWMGGFWIFPLLMILIMIVAIFLCARYFFGGFGGCRTPTSTRSGWREAPDESPLEIAKRRYARGEITKEEFEQIKNAIT